MAAGAFELEVDLAAVLRARRGAGVAAADLVAGHRRAASALERCARSWSGPRSEVFDRAAHGTGAILVGAGGACRDAEGLLGDLATAVRRTEDELDDLAAAHRALAPHLFLAGAGPADAAAAAGEGQRRSDALTARAHAAVRELRLVEQRVAGDLDALAVRVAPPTTLPGDGRRVASGPVPAGDVAAALATLTGALLAGPGGRLSVVPAPGADPVEVRRWWGALAPEQRESLLRADPRYWGNLDGVPVLDRDLANRVVLPQEVARLRHELAVRFPEGEPRAERTAYVGYGLGSVTSTDPRWLAWYDLTQRLRGASEIRLRLATRTPAGAAYLLVGFQPGAGRGRAIVSQGDPDTADHTSILVAGTTTHLGTIGADLERSEKIGDRARERSGGRVAAVTWYGYDAPPTVAADAVRLGFAERGAPLLRGFASGLRATHAPGARSHVTAVGHSYGTTVVGRAAAGGHRLDVDDVVLVASPGVGVGHGWLRDDGTTVDDLRLSGASRGHVYATRSRADVIRWATDTHLGVDPTRPLFGARVFAADPDDRHDGYWGPDDDPALDAMGAVVGGHGDEVPPADPARSVHPPLDVSIAPGL